MLYSFIIIFKFPVDTKQEATLWGTNNKKWCVYRHVIFTYCLRFSGKSTLRQRFPCRKLNGGEPLGSTLGRVGQVGQGWRGHSLRLDHPLRVVLPKTCVPGFSPLVLSSHQMLASLPLRGMSLGESALLAAVPKEEVDWDLSVNQHALQIWE